MANNNPSQSTKKKLFSVVKRLGRKIKSSPSQSTLSLPLPLSTENPGGETSLGKYRIFSLYILNCHPIVESSTVTARGMPPDCSPVMMDSSQYPNYRTPPASSGPHALATSQNTLTPHGYRRLTPDNPRQGRTSNSKEGNSQLAAKTDPESRISSLQEGPSRRSSQERRVSSTPIPPRSL
jgi:hypothetical protein